jgi:replicative DNA helicase
MKDAISALVDLSLERTVLGQIMTFDKLYQLFEEAGLAADDFFREEHRMVFAAAQSVQDAGGRPDYVTVAQQLRVNGELDRVGIPYLGAMTECSIEPSEANILFELARLQELSAGRAAYYAGQKLQKDLQAPGGLADGALLRHLDAVQAIVERCSHISATSS